MKDFGRLEIWGLERNSSFEKIYIFFGEKAFLMIQKKKHNMKNLKLYIPMKKSLISFNYLNNFIVL